MARILVIDDDRLRELLRVLLEKAGHEVDEAPEGGAGLRAYRARPADLVVCDLFMPGQEGLETIRALRLAAPAAKVLAISGGGLHGTVGALPTALLLGAVAALHKPFGGPELLGAVARALGRED